MLHNSQKDFLRRHIGPSEEDQKKIRFTLILLVWVIMELTHPM